MLNLDMLLSEVSSLAFRAIFVRTATASVPAWECICLFKNIILPWRQTFIWKKYLRNIVS